MLINGYLRLIRTDAIRQHDEIELLYDSENSPLYACL